MATEKVIVYRSLAEQRQDEYWMKFLDMNPWFATGLFYILCASIVALIGYTIYSIISDRIRWRRWK